MARRPTVTTIVQIEHPVRDYPAWKATFDRDPVGREAGGVVRYRIFRSPDDPAYVAIDLEFDDAAKARSFREALHRLWQTPVARAALAGEPRLRIVAVVDVAY